MPSVTEKKLLTNGEVIRLITVTVFAASLWFRLEYKSDEASEKILKKIDEHMLSDKFEKQIMSTEIAVIKEQIKDIQIELKQIPNREFVRPSTLKSPNRKKIKKEDENK